MATASRGKNYTPPRGARTIEGVANALNACKTAGDVAGAEDVARRFVGRRRGTRCFSLTRQETRVLDGVEAAAALVGGRGLAPGDPLDSAFWAEANRLADACWEGEVKTRDVEHVLATRRLTDEPG